MLSMGLYGLGDCMLKKKVNGSWADTSMLKKQDNGVWSDCTFAKKKNNGAWSIVWLKTLVFTSRSQHATINPPTITQLEMPSSQLQSHNRVTLEMSTTYYANAGDEIKINYRHWTNRPSSYYVYTHTGVYFTGSTFTQNYNYELPGNSSAGGASGTFTTTANSTGFGTLTIRYENDNPDNGGGYNYGAVNIGNITIAGLQVYTCSTN